MKLLPHLLRGPGLVCALAAFAVTPLPAQTPTPSVFAPSPVPAAPPAPRTVPGLGLVLLPIPAGTFLMGSPSDEPGRDSDEGPQTKVTIMQAFWLGKYTVTQGQWKKLMGTDLVEQARRMLADDTPYNFGTSISKPKTIRDFLGATKETDPKDVIGNVGDDYPIYYVSWDEAVAFCRKLTEQERSVGRLPKGYEYRLPSEAEWEYACRAGTTEATYAGKMEIKGQKNAPVLNAIAWYGGNSSVGYSGPGASTADWAEKQYPGGDAGPRQVGGKQPNAWGLYDMLGNVIQWCGDWHTGKLPGGDATDPTGPLSGSSRVGRGGGWADDAADCRSASRFHGDPGYRLTNLGFRLALSAVGPVASSTPTVDTPATMINSEGSLHISGYTGTSGMGSLPATIPIIRDSTAAEREASFAPYANAHIGQTTVAEFLRQRSAPLLIFNEGTGEQVGDGYAVAIDRRGYYLTAAHCVQHNIVALSAAPTMQLEVVWYGDPDKPRADLAIIYVGSPLGEVFEWATQFSKGDVVFGVGQTYDKSVSPKFFTDFMAGKIVALPSESASPLGASEFIYDAPLHPGDSGGPMVAADGRLIAIHTGRAVSLMAPLAGPAFQHALAYRPDLAWLGQIINADSAMRTAEAKGDVAGAITAAGRILDFDPQNVAALNQRGKLEDLKGDHDASIADCDRAIAIDPEDLWSLIHRGEANISKGDFRGAIADMNRALKLSPKSYVLFNDRAIAEYSAGDYAGAIPDFTKAIEFDPKEVNLLVERGHAKLALDDHEGAASDFEAAIQIEPKNSQALFWRGVERKIHGDLKGALADWDESIAADPANSDSTRLYRALLLAQGGQPDAGFGQEVPGWKDGSLKDMGLFVAGHTDETALLAAAGKATDQPVLGAQCGADYCIGVMRLVRGDAAGAREFFQKSVTTGQKSRLALIFAQAELTRLAPSAVPPAPSSP